MGKKAVGHKAILTEARLKAPPSEQLIRYTHAPRLVREKKRFDQFLAIDMAHTVMLVERKILSKRDGGKILRRLRELDALGPDKFRTVPKKGSFLLQVEDFLFDKLGEEIGGRMHTGRSRIDQGAGLIGLGERRLNVALPQQQFHVKHHLLTLDRQVLVADSVERPYLNMTLNEQVGIVPVLQVAGIVHDASYLDVLVNVDLDLLEPT
jgi:argininosuccinate lyase